MTTAAPQPPAAVHAHGLLVNTTTGDVVDAGPIQIATDAKWLHVAHTPDQWRSHRVDVEHLAIFPTPKPSAN